jgi:hypothetical protein
MICWSMIQDATPAFGYAAASMRHRSKVTLLAPHHGPNHVCSKTRDLMKGPASLRYYQHFIRLPPFSSRSRTGPLSIEVVGKSVYVSGSPDSPRLNKSNYWIRTAARETFMETGPL